MAAEQTLGAGPGPVVYIDVDDTLVRRFGSKRIPLADVVELVPRLREAGAVLDCWSSGGAGYSREVAEGLGIAGCFVGFLPKPEVLIDDVPIARWRLKELHPNECRGVGVKTLLQVAR